MRLFIRRHLPTALFFVGATALPAYAVDEIQVYNAEIAKVGQWSAELHLNYALNGRKQADFPGGLVPHRALNGTPEFAYGLTDWWEVGFYAPFAVSQDGTFYSDAAKLRHLFVSPNADKRDVFYGVNFEFSYAMPQFSDTRWNIEIRPILGFRKGDFEFIVNPIVDLGLGRGGEAEFLPAARIARKINDTLSLGVEYYTALGPFRSLLPFNQQEHNIYAVADFRIGRFDVNAGVGYGLTPGSDRLMTKLIIGTDLNDETEKSGRSIKPLRALRPRLGSL